MGDCEHEALAVKTSKSQQVFFCIKKKLKKNLVKIPSSHPHSL